VGAIIEVPNPEPFYNLSTLRLFIFSLLVILKGA
jgi:hypothetical protein